MTTERSGGERDADVGAMLREWRKARSPAQIPGLDGTRGARSYVTQLDMATLLGVSERWYRYLERGERRQYTRRMIDGVVRVLDLSPAQADVLYHFTRHEPAYEQGPAAAAPDPLLLDLVRRQRDCVSFLADGAWDVLACNEVAGLHCPWVARDGANVLEWVFGPDSRYQLRDWEGSWALPLLSDVRLAWQRTPHNARLDTVVRHLRAQPEVPALWRRTAHTPGPHTRPRPMFFPLVSPEPITLRILTMGPYGTVGPYGRGELRWTVMTPVDPTIRFV
ncbi:helix-turn-helix domain-containing protein [Streptomyces sp. NPDC058001]|uniref:helix-turn-helix domain-containing protein n=1 Tax=Streptomyces sp. NPDC058001 TaxID=3346300 RepID=UPI0036F091D0